MAHNVQSLKYAKNDVKHVTVVLVNGSEPVGMPYRIPIFYANYLIFIKINFPELN